MNNVVKAICVSMLSGVVSAAELPSGQVNLLANGSFEFWSLCSQEYAQSAKGFDGKQRMVPVRWSTSAPAERSEDAHGGQYAVAVPVNGIQLSLGMLECNPGSTYSYGVWAKGSGTVTVRIKGLAAEGWQNVAETSGPATGEWTRIGGEMKIPTHLRLVNLEVWAQNGKEPLLLDDAHIACDPGFAYDADACLLKKFPRDTNTLFFADFETDQGITFTSKANKSRIVDKGRFGKGLRMEKDDLAVMSIDTDKMPAEGTLELWISPDSGGQHLTLSGGGQRIIELGATLSFAVTVPGTRERPCLGWNIPLVNQQHRPDEFTHMALTWGADGMRSYNNGSLTTMIPQKPILSIVPNNIEFGARLLHLSWSGVIDEFRLSNVRRYGVLAPKGDKIVPLPEPEVKVEEAPAAPAAFDLNAIQKEIGKLVTPLPTTEGKFEAALNDKQQHIYEASSLKPLLTHSQVNQILDNNSKGMSVAWVQTARGYTAETPDIHGAYWKLGAIKPGRYWVSVLATEFPAIFLNGRIVQATRACDPVQLWPGLWMSDLQADIALDLKPGDEIAIQYYSGNNYAARLTLNSTQPERGRRPAPLNMGGSESSIYTSHAISLDVTWQDKDSKPMPAEREYWTLEQLTGVPENIRKGPDGRPVVTVWVCNPLPVAVKAEFECVVHSFYRIVVGSHKEQITLQPHQSVERLIAFDPIDDEPSYSADASIKAIDRPELNWPEGDQIAIFEGMRQSIGWTDPFSHHMLRRLSFTEPVKSVRQVLVLNGLWEATYTPDYRLLPAPENAEWRNVRVPMNWFFNHMSEMKPRMHSMYLRRKFVFPTEAAGRTCNLVISSVQDAADAWINGQYVGQVLGGNVPMVADATQAIKVGENEIILLVRDLLPLMNPAYVNPANPQGSASYLDIPGFFSGGGVGINDVFLETSPIIAANELQALPSVRGKKITTRFELINHRPGPANVRVKTHILAEGKSVLTIDEHEVMLEPNKPMPMSFEKAWDNARLWGPEDPFLYVLAVETFDAATGERIDISRARFGFRDCWIDGPHIMFNGTPMRPIGCYTRGREAPIMTRGTGGRPDYYDEIGRMGFAPITQLSNSSSRHNLERDAFWQNAEKNAIKCINRCINYPSIIAWDLSNEWLQYMDYYAPDPMLGPKRFKTLSDNIKAYDPTRWTTASAESDWSGLSDNHNFHYMKPWFLGEAEMGHHTYYPDCEWWRPLDKHFEPGFEVRLSPHERYDILRPHKKVIMDGEYLWKVGETMPPGLAEVCDEDDVLGWAVDESSGPAFWHWMNKVEGHRDLGVSPIHPYRRAGIQARAFQPRIFLMPQLNHNAFSGAKFVRLYTMMNDTLHTADIELKWELLAPDGKVVTTGKDAIPGMKTGYNHRGQIELQMPEVKSRTRYTLNVRMVADGKFCFGRQLDVDVWPALPTPVGEVKRSVVLFDPSGKTGKILERMGITVQPLNALSEPIPQPAGKLLVIGEEALDEASATAALKVLDFVKAGGRAVFLEQTATPMGLPAPSKVDTMQWSSLCFNRMPIHPITQGLTNWDLSFWGTNHVAAKGCYSKPEQGNFLTLIDAGFHRGLEYVDLMEQYAGDGIYLLCQMPVVAKYDEEPMARELLARIIRYAGSSEAFLKPAATLQAVIAKDDATAKRLDDVAGEFKVTRLDAPLDPKAPVLVEAAIARAASDADRANLAGYLQAGGTAVVTCSTPDDAVWLTPLAGKDVTFTVQKFLTWHGRAMRMGYSPFTAGLSHIDLYWKNYDKAESGGSQSDNITLAIEPLQDYSVSVEGARELVWPGALLELKVGQGTLLIDQRRWTTSAGELATPAFRNVSALLLGLGVKMAPAMPKRQLPREIIYRTINLTQFANRSLADETMEDGLGGWSDQGAGADLRTFATGKLGLQGVPFVVGEHPRSCIVLASANRPGADKMPTEVTIPIGYATEGFYFLQGFAYSGGDGNILGVYQVVYADGTTFDIPLKAGINTRDWASAPSSTFVREKDTSSSVAWTGSCERFSVVAVYKMLWVNPRPDVEVKAIRYYKTKDMSGVPVLMGLTSVLKREFKALTPAEQQQVRQLIAQSDKAAKEKDLAGAETLIRQAIATDPTAWDAFQKLADILEQKGTEDQRLELYQTWVDNGAVVPLPYNRVAEILERRKDLRSALEFYTRSLQVEWNQPPVIENKKRLEAAGAAK